VKLIVPERGASEVAETWLRANRRASSRLLYPEARAAVARAERMGRVLPQHLAASRRRLEALWTAVDRVELTEELALRAGDLADAHGLRAYDAVHLASLEQVGDSETVLVSADVELLEAARSLGFAVAPGLA
jgi:predicted nucleic acid-binding protein